MSSKQANLRKMMRLAREEKKAQKLSKPNSILKKKSSFNVKAKTKSETDLLAGYSDSDSDDPGTDIVKSNGSQSNFKITPSASPLRESGRRKKQRTEPTVETNGEVSENALQNDNKVGSQNSKNEGNSEGMDSDVMKEFEELLEYEAPAEDIVKKTSKVVENSTTNSQAGKVVKKVKKSSIHGPVKSKKKSKDATVMTSSVGISEEIMNEVEQVSYEARLAKLILLRNRKSHEKEDEVEKNAEVDFSPGLAFQESLTNDAALTSSKELRGNQRNEVKNTGEVSSVASLKNVLKRKRAKKKQNLAVVHNGVEEDCYWA